MEAVKGMYLGKDDAAGFELFDDGSLSIEVDAGEQGSSEIGWWDTTGRITLSPEEVEKLRRFLTTGP